MRVTDMAVRGWNEGGRNAMRIFNFDTIIDRHRRILERHSSETQCPACHAFGPH